MKLKLFAASAFIILAAGCTSTGISPEQYEQLRADVQSTRAIAEQARADAQQANDNAMQAKMMAQQNEEKMSRVFRKSQLK